MVGVKQGHLERGPGLSLEGPEDEPGKEAWEGHV